MDYLRRNNFDLIRLAAASQVMLLHGMTHLNVDAPLLEQVVGHFPGVPGFFLMSGFLISASWERNSDLRIFTANRVLRIFPALWATVAASAISLLVLYDRDVLCMHAWQFGIWIVSQSTVLQQWNPAFLRGYGIGVVNGSLWTISVEITFYALTPLLYLVGKRSKEFDLLLWTGVGLSFGIQYALEMDLLPFGQQGVSQLIELTFVPWVGMFLLVSLRNVQAIAFTR